MVSQGDEQTGYAPILAQAFGLSFNPPRCRGKQHAIMSRTVPSGWPPESVPRWLSRECAAFYLGMSPTHFDAQVRAGNPPQPRRFTRLTRYDCAQLDSDMAKIPLHDNEN